MTEIETQRERERKRERARERKQQNQGNSFYLTENPKPRLIPGVCALERKLPHGSGSLGLGLRVSGFRVLGVRVLGC